MADEKTAIEPLEEVSDDDLEDLCDAAESAILDGGGFGWLKPPPLFWLLINMRSVGSKSTNLEYSCTNLTRAVPTSPLRCLAIKTSVNPLTSPACWDSLSIPIFE